ncbi:PEP-CTERM sorting domain-containing protein [Ectothiorhodospira shaposhnikovii]|uniref:PEP-CTERM sorting domain-containing protein n=1 Tax=Ectothiorhodospira shaposhnikovii TaxID=1054 RepID=UPI0039A36398
MSVVGQAEGSINPIFSSWLPSANSLGGSSESNPDNLNTPNNLVTAVPEPGMLALFGAGLLGAMGFLRRRRAI